MDAREYRRVRAAYDASKREYTRLQQQTDRVSHLSSRQQTRRVARLSQGRSAPPPPQRTRRLYLLSHVPGTERYVIGDGSRSYDVQIGEHQRCSCGVPACAHVLWALSRIMPRSVAASVCEACASSSSDTAPSRASPRAGEARTTAGSGGAAGAAGSGGAAWPPVRPLDDASVDWLLGLSGHDAWLLAQPTLQPAHGPCDVPSAKQARRSGRGVRYLHGAA